MTSWLERTLLFASLLVSLPVACTGQDPSSLLDPGGTGRPPLSAPGGGGGPQGEPTPSSPPSAQPSSTPTSLPTSTGTAPTPPPPDASVPQPPPPAPTADAGEAPPPDVDAAPPDDGSTLGPPILDSSPANAPVDGSPAPTADASSPADTSVQDSSSTDTTTPTPVSDDAGGSDAFAPLGSCANPDCSTDDQGDCFCTAQVNGQTIQLGCGPDGTCACFLDQQLSTNTVSDPGVCNDLSSASQLFVQLCACQ
jgi:hypothetical protein